MYTHFHIFIYHILIPKYTSRSTSAAPLAGRRHISSSSQTDLCTSKARSTYNNPGSMVTNTIVGTATTKASARLMTHPDIHICTYMNIYIYSYLYVYVYKCINIYIDIDIH
jgi:hypothetical protein